MAVFDADIQITMRGVSDPIGLPYTVNPVELVDREALVELREGPAGPEGPQGDPAWPWTWMGDVPDFAALQGMGLGYGDARKAWRVVAENAVYFWTGQDWIRFEQAFQSPGRQGPANQPVGAAIAGPVGSTAAATITGTAPNQVLTLTFPRGITGEQGDPGQAGAINDAADVIAPDDSRQDSVLAWDADDSKWRGVPHPKLAGPWALGAGQVGGGSNISAASRVVSTITIPAQPYAWRPIILSGDVGVRVHVSALNDTRVAVEVRLGSADGPIIAWGMPIGGSNTTMVQLSPRWEIPISPDSDYASVAPNQTTTLYVIVRRVSGTKNYTIVNTGSQMLVMAQALKVQP
ncbi:hypothetical protein IU414_06655 [Nocardia farcinica]|uniref:hypothetical protein n=1 Tax=Nocardia farcinica TaxID=37329 RepID=UPI001895AEE0|nr:hypothetical protein [Nocardia farcinica]MBF6254392.1 hypothetical protein [Nocardia farcinica]MBF6584440.1 hypothetical protein [Nocardia farcinica]